MKMRKSFLWLLAAIITLLCIYTLPENVYAADADDLGFSLNENGDGYVVDSCYMRAYGELVIPSEYNGKPVTGIYNLAFRNCTLLTSITLPDTIKTIGSGAFYGCNRLTSITIPASVTHIDAHPFAECDDLTNLLVAPGNSVYHSAGNCIVETASKTLVAGCNNSQIPADGSVTVIGDWAFAYCDLLSNVMIPNSITAIRENAFRSCESLQNIVIPDSVTTIGYAAFYWCSDLKSITISSSVTSIDGWAFANCYDLTEIIIPDGITTIGEMTFSACYNLASITLPGSITSIGNSAFSECHNLTGIALPDGVTSIGQKAFERCTGLTDIHIPGSVTAIGDFAFSVCESLTAITIPEGVHHIGEGMFYGCTKLTSVKIPGNVTGIGDIAFGNCSGLRDIAIPESVTAIGFKAFDGCTNLTTLVYCGTQKQWDAIKLDSYNDALSNAKLQLHNYENGTCTICHESEEKACAHNWQAATCEQPRICTLCQITEGEPLGHKMQEMQAAVEATCTTSGKTAVWICVNGCGKTEGGVRIPAAGHQMKNGTCDVCGHTEPIAGDIDGNRTVNQEDVVYLLLHVMFGKDNYPLTGASADIIENGSMDLNDAVYLLLHVTFGEKAYPLGPKIMSYEEFIAAELDTPVVVETYIQATQSWWNNSIVAYTQNEEGAYFIYRLTCTEDEADMLIPGTKVRISGYKKMFMGEIEISDATFEILEGSWIAPALDITDLLGAEDLIKHQNKRVTFKGMTVVPIKDTYGNEHAFLYAWDGTGNVGSDLYFNVSINGVTCNVYVESYLTDADTEVYKAVQTLQIGDVIDLEGFLYWYDGANPHITSVTPAA